jgi:hypothetical protein
MKGGYNINMQKKIYIVVSENLKTNKLCIRRIFQREDYASNLARKLKRYYKCRTNIQIHIIERTIDLSLEQCI